jgi:hypothetical protein
MQRLTLEDIIPEQPEFSLSATGHRYALRSITLDDQVYFRRKFGSQEAIQDAFRTMDWEILSQIIFHLMIDKADFRAQTIEEIDDEGKTVQRTMTGPELLRKAIKLNETVEILGALNRVIMNSNPVLDRFMRDELKKKLEEINKAAESASPAGDTSSISSQASTDGASNTSEAAHSENSTSRSSKSTKGAKRTSRQKQHSTESSSTLART